MAGVTIYFAPNGIVSIQQLVSTKSPASAAPSPTPHLSRVPKQPPTAINIPKIGKSLPIKPAHVTDNTWDLFDDAVAWLSTSAAPGQGNVILYAHNWQSLWGDLYLLKPGDSIVVQHENAWKEYIVTESREIMANDVQAILSDKNQLTLYTCEGSFNQKRRVVYAKPSD